MIKNIITIAITSTIIGCANMEPAEPQPIRPILSCDDCSGLTYFGPQQEAAPDPRVQMADIIVGGITKVVGVAGGVYAATEIASTVAGAGKYVVGPTNSEKISNSTKESTISADIRDSRVISSDIRDSRVTSSETVKEVEPIIVTPGQ